MPRRVTWHSSYTDDPQRLGATVYNLIARATRRQGFVHPRCITVQVSIAVFIHFFRTAIRNFRFAEDSCLLVCYFFFFQLVVTCFSKAPISSTFRVEQTTAFLILASSCRFRSHVSVCTLLCPWVLVAFGSASLSWRALVRPHLVHHQGYSPSSADLLTYSLHGAESFWRS